MNFNAPSQSTSRRPRLTVSRLVLLALATALLVQGCFPDFEQFEDFEPVVEDAENNGADPDMGDMPEDPQDMPDMIDQPDMVDMQDMPEDLQDMPEDMPDMPEDMPNDMPDTVDMPEDMPDMPEDMPNDMPEDMPEDMPDVEDEPDLPEIPVIGTVCENDEACEGGATCLDRINGGMCSIPCETDDVCPAGSVCGYEAGLGWCLPSCDNNTSLCSRPELSRADLQCQPWLGDNGSVCVSDLDNDQVLDAEDNCPSAYNPEQYDTDLDGIGDACDDDELCPGDGTGDGNGTGETYLNRATPPEPLSQGALLHIPGWKEVVYLGGKNNDGESVTRALSYHYDENSWTESRIPSLPYPAYDLSATYIPATRQIIATPGRDRDRLLILDLYDSYGERIEDPQWRLGPVLPQRMIYTQISHIFPNQIAIAGYAVPEEPTEPYQLYTFLYDVEAGQLFPAVTGENAQYQSINRNSAGPLLLIPQRNPEGKGYFYLYNTYSRTTLYKVDAAGGLLEIISPLTPEPFLDLNGPLTFPIAGFQGTGPNIFLARMDTGLMQKVDTGAIQPGARPTDYTLELPSPETVDLENTRFQSIYLRDKASFLVLTTTNAEGQLSSALRENYFACHDAITLANYDADSDGVADLFDNCPTGTQANPNQEDLDYDGIGDICDADTDGDGILNATENGDGVPEGDLTDYSLDTDNDGVPNSEDQDDDNDRILDAEDDYRIDTDNDGLVNWIDNDDDGDLLSDTAEITQGTDPLDFFSLPGGERIAYVKSNGEARSLYVSTLPSLGKGEPQRSLEIEAMPYWPRLHPANNEVLFSDTTVETPTLYLLDVTGEQPTVRVPVPGLDPYGLSFVATSEIMNVGFTTRSRPEGQEDYVWSLYNLPRPTLLEGVLENNRPFYTTADRVYGLDHLSGRFVYGRGPQECPVCFDLFQYAGDSNRRLEETNTGQGERLPRFSADGNSILFLSGDGDVSRVYLYIMGGPDAGLHAVTSRDWKINSADFAPDESRVVVSAKRTDEPDGSYHLYLIDRRLGSWTRLTQGEDDYLEVDFAP